MSPASAAGGVAIDRQLLRRPAVIRSQRAVDDPRTHSRAVLAARRPGERAARLLKK